MDDQRHGAHLMPAANFQALIASVAAAASEQSAQWNSADKNASITLSNSDRDATGGSLVSVRSILGRSSGKYYFEITMLTGSASHVVGFANGSFALSTYPGNGASSAGHTSGGNFVNTWTKAQAGTFTLAANDVVGFAIDLTAGKAWVAKNNTWQLTGDPAAGTNEWVSGITGTVYPAAAPSSNSSRIHTKTAELTYSPPSGFSQWAAA